MDIRIQNVLVSFPFKPYGCQLSFMNRVIESLESSKNCLLESPTGTGKTLSLLCASLAWLNKKIVDAEAIQCSCKHFQSNSEYENPTSEKAEHDVCDCSETEKQASIQVPKIYYCTRTHKQISQVIRELRRTKYRHARMTILSSRQHSCINPVIRQEPSIMEACRSLITTGFCEYDQPRKKTDLVRKLNKLDSVGAWDLEDLVDALTELPACPYFCARKLAKTADIVFCPYNYLLEPINRSASDLDLKGNVIIIDEAHNVEDAARDAASFKITENQLSTAKDDLAKLVTRNFEPVSCTKLIAMLDAMLRVMQLTRSRLVRAGETTEPTHVWTGQEISGLMSAVELGPGQLSEMQAAHRALVAKVTENSERPGRFPVESQSPKPNGSTLHLFDSVFTALKYMFRDDQRHLADYRVVLTETVDYERKPSVLPLGDLSQTSSPWFSKRSAKSRLVESRELSLNFWCLNPSVIFSEVASEARCVILVSGTLSPLNAMEAELGVPFPIRLEANHVIGKDRLLVGALSHGPNGRRMCATYQQQSTYDFQDELGQVLLHASFEVPGGVLCFFPSYSLLDKLFQRWEATGLLSKLQEIKHVMVEPRSSVGLDSWLEEFYKAVDENCPPPSMLHKRSHSKNGALVLAVCRGKVSEGLDFADSYGRLVIAVGIPYPAFNNPLVRQKREFNDTTRRRASDVKTCPSPSSSLLPSSPSPTNRSFSGGVECDSNNRRVLSGSEWYDAQAYRALNQALGRCIRHMNDWGAVLLVDARFVEQPSRYMTGISRWIQSRATGYKDWSSFVTCLRTFVNTHQICTKVDREAEELADIFA